MISGLCVLAGLPAGCGVKPDRVDPPASVRVDTFPQTYPPADAGAHPPGRYLPPGYTPPSARNKQDQPADKGHTTP